ncbi:Leucine-rich repeat domain superfamily [Sesbania bispinosa]|nr:Leucine-rich repeat domain superfamily [Sesbania bispinosa]
MYVLPKEPGLWLMIVKKTVIGKMVMFTIEKDESTFEDLCGDATFPEEEIGITESDVGSWGLLDGQILARIFHFLRSDFKSLVFASLTCKHWRAAARFYKEVSIQVNLSSLGHSCTDTMLWNIMNAYEKDKINSIILMGCVNITAHMLEKILLSFPGLCTIDIRGCSQFGELTSKFDNLKWIKSRSSRMTRIAEEPHKIRSLKHITEQGSSVSKSSNLGIDDFGQLKDYFEVWIRETRRSSYSAKTYTSGPNYMMLEGPLPFYLGMLAQDVGQLKNLKVVYKRMEEFLASRLKEIMKTNSCDFFVPKLATRLEESSKSWDNGLPAVICSTSSKYKKNRLVNERKYRSNGTHGGLDKKFMDSESETSDDFDRSYEDGKSVSDTTTTDTESDQEGLLRESRGDGYFTPEEGKYDIIDQYVIVADEEDVRRKMRVSLPDDYAEKLSAQKNGTEESDMELPEVKDFKPRSSSEMRLLSKKFMELILIP